MLPNYQRVLFRYQPAQVLQLLSLTLQHLDEFLVLRSRLGSPRYLRNLVRYILNFYHLLNAKQLVTGRVSLCVASEERRLRLVRLRGDRSFRKFYLLKSFFVGIDGVRLRLSLERAEVCRLLPLHGEGLLDCL